MVPKQTYEAEKRDSSHQRAERAREAGASPESRSCGCGFADRSKLVERAGVFGGATRPEQLR